MLNIHEYTENGVKFWRIDGPWAEVWGYTRERAEKEKLSIVRIENFSHGSQAELTDAPLKEDKTYDKISTKYVLSGHRKAVEARVAAIHRAFPSAGYSTSARLVKYEGDFVIYEVFRMNSCD